MADDAGALARVTQLVTVARRLADRGDSLGREARQRLPEATGLSPHNVELGLTRCLEGAPTDAELGALCAAVTSAPAVHVLLSANVFVGAHRALALALASSAAVSVRPSQRESVMVELLERGAPGLFSIVEQLAPRAGDHVWAYGRDETLAELRRTLTPGCVLHAHGAGFGVAVLEEAALGRTGPPVSADALARQLAEHLALNVSLFDQRGCLSPRVLLFDGSRQAFERFGRLLASALDDMEADCPRGRLDRAERADARRVADTTLMAGSLLTAGRGWVALVDDGAGALLPPPGRHIVMVRTDSPLTWLTSHGASITAVGTSVTDRTHAAIGDALPWARRSTLGAMQSPPFDGPVDGRASRAGEVVGAARGG